MTVRNTIAATLVALSIMMPAAGALAQEVAPEEGKWYYLEDAPAVAPKPACPAKKPNRRDSFKEMWLWQGGKYAECRWDPQGRKKRATGYYWTGSECLAASVSVPQFDYGACMRQELFYLSPRAVIFGPQPGYGYTQPGYYPTFRVYAPARTIWVNGRLCQPHYQCEGGNDSKCHIPPCPSTSY